MVTLLFVAFITLAAGMGWTNVLLATIAFLLFAIAVNTNETAESAKQVRDEFIGIKEDDEAEAQHVQARASARTTEAMEAYAKSKADIYTALWSLGDESNWRARN